MPLYAPPTQDFLQKTLDAQLLTGVTASATLNNTTGLANLPGVMIVDRINTNNVETPSAREVIAYTGTSGATVTTLSRGLAGTTDQDHAVGAIVEFTPDIIWADSIYDALANLVNTTTLAVDTAKVVTPTGADFNGNEIIIDADADTTITADTDDRIDYKLGGADTFRMGVSDLDLVISTANIQVAGADPKRTMYVPASAMFPSTTGGCASLAQVESATNDVNIKVLDFDGAGTSKESAEFGIQSPSYWDAGTVTAQFIWYATAGSGTVNWECQGVAFSDDDALDTAFGTLQEVTDTLLATGDVHITAETSAITIAGSPVAGDWINFRVNRDPANDTNTSDARLMGIRIRFNVKQYNDV